jgi:putative phage-type endonuclease
MLTEKQLAMRKTGLGGSDIAAALGVSPWKTQLKLWAEKLGKVPDQPQNDAMEWGHRLEPAIYAKFAEMHPEIKVSHGGGTVRHEEYPCLLATPDAFLKNGSNGSGILEVKTARAGEWETVPLHYMLQVIHYMYVLNRDFAYFAVLHHGTQYREYGPFFLDRTDYELLILPALLDFWSKVEEKVPDLEPAEIQDLPFFSGHVTDKSAVTADFDLVKRWQHWTRMSQTVKTMTEEMNLIKLELAAAAGPSKYLDSPTGKRMLTQIDIEASQVVDRHYLEANWPEAYKDSLKDKAGYRKILVREYA